MLKNFFKYLNISNLFSVTQHVFILRKTVYEVWFKNYFKPVLESALLQRKKLLLYNKDVQYNHMVFFFWATVSKPRLNQYFSICFQL